MSEEESSESHELDTVDAKRYIKLDIPVTSDYISLYEFTHVVHIRAAQLANGATTDIDIRGLVQTQYKNINIHIAEQEIYQKKCPISIQRVLCDNSESKIIEERAVNDLIIPKCIYDETDLLPNKVKEEKSIKAILDMVK
jgi:DNA-directed RNA polymerase subunit K/omega